MQPTTLSIIVPCYNEEETLEQCIETVLRISSERLKIEIIIVNDASTDNSLTICQRLLEKHAAVVVLSHEVNQGKGAALRTGFRAATHDFVAVQDADLEYDPQDLIRLLEPLKDQKADVVLGSRFNSGNSTRVLYFWHSMGNKFLTLLSNMFTDLNLTDMETCYKVFKREIIQSIEIKENRFGFEPEVVAKIAQMRCRIYEMGISYHGRTYAEGKKIGVRDGFRALYCIFRYNAHKAPLPIQFFFYLFIGGVAAVFNVCSFLLLRELQISVTNASLTAFGSAAILNYILCTLTIFRRNSYWKTTSELFAYAALVCCLGLLDLWMTELVVRGGNAEWISKSAPIPPAVILNYLGRRYLIFPEARKKSKTK
jgi:glycosyltransferase involved in cell wall biosynthesis